jgi:hypothetical protein
VYSSLCKWIKNNLLSTIKLCKGEAKFDFVGTNANGIRWLLFMQYNAKLIEINPLIEEEAVLEIDGQRIVAFINNCPFEIIQGGQYLVEMELAILDDFIITKIHTSEKGIEQIGDSFSHFIRGTLDIDTGNIDAGIILEVDSEFLFDYGYLHNQNVQIRVDRLSVNFIGR